MKKLSITEQIVCGDLTSGIASTAFGIIDLIEIYDSPIVLVLATILLIVLCALTIISLKAKKEEKDEAVIAMRNEISYFATRLYLVIISFGTLLLLLSSSLREITMVNVIGLLFLIPGLYLILYSVLYIGCLKLEEAPYDEKEE